MRHKRIVVTRYGGPDVITLIEEDVPVPKAGEVRQSQARAAHVDPRDFLAKRRGTALDYQRLAQTGPNIEHVLQYRLSMPEPGLFWQYSEGIILSGSMAERDNGQPFWDWYTQPGSKEESD